MPQNDFSIQLEDLLLALDTYTKKMDKQFVDSSNLHHANYQQAQDIANWARELTSLLKTYQNKESLLQADFVAAISQQMTSIFQANEDNYHKRIDKGFTKHITDSSDTFLEKTKQLNDDIDTLNESVTGFTSNVNDTREKIAKQNTDASKQMLDNVKKKFNFYLTLNLVAVVVTAITLGLGIAWMLIPSKAEIAERSSDYQGLQKAGVAHNVVKVSGQDGYYARIDPKDCFKDEKSSFYSQSLLCKFK